MGVQDIDIDEKLEEKLKKHGLNRRNAKTIIHVCSTIISTTM